MKARKIRQPEHSRLNMFAIRQQSLEAVPLPKASSETKLKFSTFIDKAALTTESAIRMFPRLCSRQPSSENVQPVARQFKQISQCQQPPSEAVAKQLKQIRRALQHRHEHRNHLCKIYQKWDQGQKGGIDAVDLIGMTAELGVTINDQQAKAFIRQLQPNSEMLSLPSFLKMVQEPKRMSYFSDKSALPMQIMESEEIQKAGGYLNLFKNKYDKASKEIMPHPKAAEANAGSMKSQLLQKYHLAVRDCQKSRPQRPSLGVLKDVAADLPLTQSVVIDRSDPDLQLGRFDSKLFTGSVRNYKLFQKLDVDKDGYITRKDLAAKMSPTSEDSQAVNRVFDAAGSDHLNYSTFSQIFSSGMGVESPNAMYPRLRGRITDKSIVEGSRNQMKHSILKQFDPNSSLVRDQYKTRFSGTPSFQASRHFGENEEWMKAGDLNEKVRHLVEERHKLQEIDQARLQAIRQHREQQASSLAQQDSESERRGSLRLESWRLQSWAYQHVCQLRNEWR